jgi:hypothetical protein
LDAARCKVPCPYREVAQGSAPSSSRQRADAAELATISGVTPPLLRALGRAPLATSARTNAGPAAWWRAEYPPRYPRQRNAADNATPQTTRRAHIDTHAHTHAHTRGSASASLKNRQESILVST